MERNKKNKSKIRSMNNRQKATVELRNGRFRLPAPSRIEDLNPKALMLCAAAQCAGLTVMGLLAKEGISPKTMEITIEGTLDTEKLQASSTYRSFSIRYNIECRSLGEQNTITEAIHQAQEQTCGMVAMLKRIAPVSFDVAIVSTESVKV